MEIKRNNSIDIFRLVCALLVVVIHTHPFADQNEIVGFIAVDVLPRMAVPFFFCVSGYYYHNALQRNGTIAIHETFFKALKIYTLWSIPYFIRDAFVFLGNGSLSLKGLMFEFLLNFFVLGSAYHFWSFVALLYSILFIGLIYKTRKLKLLLAISWLLYALRLLGTSYYALGISLPVIQDIISATWFESFSRIVLMGFPMFMSGVLVGRFKNIKQIRKCWIASIIGFFLEIGILVYFQIHSSVVVTIFLYPLTILTVDMLLQHPLPKFTGIAQKTRSLANFLFYSHPFAIWLITSLGYGGANIGLYLITVGVCVIVWENSGIVVRKYVENRGRV